MISIKFFAPFLRNRKWIRKHFFLFPFSMFIIRQHPRKGSLQLWLQEAMMTAKLNKNEWNVNDFKFLCYSWWNREVEFFFYCLQPQKRFSQDFCGNNKKSSSRSLNNWLFDTYSNLITVCVKHFPFMKNKLCKIACMWHLKKNMFFEINVFLMIFLVVRLSRKFV